MSYRDSRYKNLELKIPQRERTYLKIKTVGCDEISKWKISQFWQKREEKYREFRKAEQKKISQPEEKQRKKIEQKDGQQILVQTDQPRICIKWLDRSEIFSYIVRQRKSSSIKIGMDNLWFVD